MKGGTFLGLLPIGEVCRCSHQQVPGFCGQSAVQFFGQGCCRARCATTCYGPDSVNTVWRLRSCSSSISFFDDRCPQVQFLNPLFMPVVMRTLVEIPQVQFSVQFVPVVTPTLVEIPQLQFLDKVFIPVVVVSGADGQTVQKTVEYPQLQFLDKVFFVLLSGADGPTVQKTVEYPQLQFQDKAQTMSSWSLLWRRCKSRLVLDRALFLGRILR